MSESVNTEGVCVRERVRGENDVYTMVVGRSQSLSNYFCTAAGNRLARAMHWNHIMNGTSAPPEEINKSSYALTIKCSNTSELHVYPSIGARPKRGSSSVVHTLYCKQYTCWINVWERD